ncbi:MAG: UvrB/UvrC motif-containing protein [Phycisphaerales bacterium]
MAQKRDISSLLKEWPYQPGQVNARLIVGADNLPRVQVRLDLGVLQMFADGRPDGEHPFGFPSLLEYHEARVDGEVQQEEVAEGETPKDPPPERTEDEKTIDEPDGPVAEGPGTDNAEGAATDKPDVRLTTDECRALREEAAQYYQRYVACLALDEFQRVVRDTTRNLRVVELCAQHAESDHDRSVLEQFRPYILMLRARALASQAIKENELKAAVVALDEALDALKRHFTKLGSEKGFEQSSEVRMLRDMREALAPRLPVSQKAELRQRLQRAIETENYELAAILRDELKQLKE